VSPFAVRKPYGFSKHHACCLTSSGAALHSLGWNTRWQPGSRGSRPLQGGRGSGPGTCSDSGDTSKRNRRARGQSCSWFSSLCFRRWPKSSSSSSEYRSVTGAASLISRRLEQSWQTQRVGCSSGIDNRFLSCDHAGTLPPWWNRSLPLPRSDALCYAPVRPHRLRGAALGPTLCLKR